MTRIGEKNSGRPGKPKGFYAGRIGYGTYLFVRGCYLLADLILLVPLLMLTLVSRFAPRRVDIGLGPLPTINSKYHKKSFEEFGYTAETFVYHTWYFTSEFDVNIGNYSPRVFGPYISYIYSIFRYRCIYTYFNGGPLGFTTLLARLEPFLYQMAGIKTVIMPYGGDIYVLTRSSSMLVVDAYAKDYPGFRHQRNRTAALIDVWTHGADHIVAGCDWVDFLYFWDTLMLSHFAIDTKALVPRPRSRIGARSADAPLTVLHAPNHRNLKGTPHIIKAVNDLQQEGVAIELKILEGVPNEQVPEMVRSVDVVIDQLILGGYAMFAIESMALAKPVVCHVRQEFRDLFEATGLLEEGELPLIDATPLTIKSRLRELARTPRDELDDIGRRSREFVEKHHSIEAIGRTFDRINRSLGIVPSSRS